MKGVINDQGDSQNALSKSTFNVPNIHAQHLNTNDDKSQQSKINKRPIIEVDANNIEQKVRKCSNNKKVKITFNKPNSMVTSCDMKLARLREGVRNTQFCVKPKKVWISSGGRNNSINIALTKEWLSR